MSDIAAVLIVAIIYFLVGTFLEYFAYQDFLRNEYTVFQARCMAAFIGFLWLPLFAWWLLYEKSKGWRRTR